MSTLFRLKIESSPRFHELNGLYLQGPRDAKTVRKLGYAFDKDPAKAWPFATRGEVSRKQAVLARHMSWPRSSLQIEEYTP